MAQYSVVVDLPEKDESKGTIAKTEFTYKVNDGDFQPAIEIPVDAREHGPIQPLNLNDKLVVSLIDYDAAGIPTANTSGPMEVLDTEGPAMRSGAFGIRATEIPGT